MGRPKHEFWQYVEKTGSSGKDLKCIFCKEVFEGGPSISRMRLHLAGIQGQGIQICDKVPSHVKARAHEASCGRNKKRKTVPSSSTNEEYNLISEQQNHQVENPVGDEDMMEMQVREIEQLGEVGMGNYEETHVGQPLQFVESKGEELLTTKLKGAEFETHIKQIYSCLRDDDNVSKVGIYGMGGVGKTELAKHIYNKLVTAASPFDHVYWVNVSEHFSIYGLQNTIARMVDLDLSSVDNEDIRAAKLSEALNKNKSFVLFLDDVWNYIPFDRIGIPGCKLVITTRSLDVCRSMDCQKNIKVEPLGYGAAWELFLQKLGHQLVPNVEPIAREIVLECQGLPLGIEIMARNMKRKDDIHEWRDALHKLTRGIPKQENSEIFDNLKRSYDCLNDPSLQQCFLYFVLFVPPDQKLESLDIKEVIDFLIDVGVIERSSRKQAFDEGHTMLNKLENLCLFNGGHTYSGSRWVSMHGLVRKVAIQLMGTDAQVWEKLFKMPKWGNWSKDLMRISLIYNEIKEIPSGYSPNCPNLSCILLRGSFLISIGDSFFELLCGLKVLDLSETSITKLPSSISHLVNLSSLLLGRCEKLSHVPSLALLSALKKLDLDGSVVKEFPEGIEMLSNLKYLNLRGTEIVLPPGILPKLSQLEVLLLSNSFAVAAKEIASLSMLQELECCFHDIGELKTYVHTTRTPSSDLMRWSFHVGEIDLEDEDELFEDNELADNFKVCLWNCSISEGDIPLSHLEDVKYLRFINCSIEIENCDDLQRLLSFSSSPSVFKSLEEISIDSNDLLFLFDNGDIPIAVPSSPVHVTFSLLKSIRIWECSSMKKLFPQGLMSNLQNLEDISISSCDNMEELISMEVGKESYNSNSFSLLKRIEIRKCPSMKKLFPQGLMSNLQNLEEIEVNFCDNMEELISREEGKESYNSNSFSLLKRIQIWKCPSMKKLFPQGLMSNLQNLEEIKVWHCDNMKELIAVEEREREESCNSSNGTTFIFTLPKLRSVGLVKLPQLKSICSQEIVCDSLEYIEVRHCVNLERIALSLFLPDQSQLSPLPSLKAIHIYPQHWWELLVDFDHPDAKNVLLPLCSFEDQFMVDSIF
ncbi:probable disease resistance protein At4g27220 isoform X1 [Manihot esculenta]|nr:probable disease resistance protein At4g27220 isoform X1 [Manihot esculenta]XP_043816912.1 probable disease resistance protein At4g27220 isoform X1 [Manihot esculenta]